MQTFPMFLMMRDRQVLILGGGEQAAQKCRLLLKTEAQITVQAPEIDAELADLVARGRIAHDPSQPTAAACAKTAITFIGTGCPGADAALHALAKSGGALVNVVDQPPLCDAFTPSIVDRDPLVVAIGTEGAAPVLGRQIKTRIEELLEPDLGALVARAGSLRDQVAHRVAQSDRRGFWRWVFAGAPRRLHAAGQAEAAYSEIEDAIRAGRAPEDTSGLITYLPSNGIRDQMTLQAVQRLQEADLILYDSALVDLLELARRDADREELTETPDLADASRIVVLYRAETPPPPLPGGSIANIEHLPGLP